MVDPTGRPISWAVELAPWVTRKAEACVQEQLAQARFACSQSGQAGEAAVPLNIYVR